MRRRKFDERSSLPLTTLGPALAIFRYDALLRFFSPARALSIERLKLAARYIFGEAMMKAGRREARAYEGWQYAALCLAIIRHLISLAI